MSGVPGANPAPVSELTLLKKQLKKKVRRIKTKNNFEVNEQGQKRHMFDVDLGLIKGIMDPEILKQLGPLVDSAEKNEQEYKLHIKNLEELRKFQAGEGTKFLQPSVLTEAQVRSVALKEKLDPEQLAGQVYIYKPQPINQQTAYFFNKLSKIPAMNLSATAKSYRKITTIALVLLSPWLRIELDDLFVEWKKVYLDTLMRTFTEQTATAEAEESDSEDEESEREGWNGTQREAGAEMSFWL